MRLIAHRGFASTAPENTVRAVEAAAGVADEIEVDVRRCASGELIVIHDETVDRITDGSGAVREHAYSDLSALDVLETEEEIPTLTSVLRAIPDEVRANVELKERDTAIDALDAIESVHPNSIVSSFFPDVLENCRIADSTVPRAYITEESGTESVEIAAELECENLHASKEVCTRELVSTAHRAGLDVNAWTVDSRSEADALVGTGIDGVIADRPDVLAGASV